MESENKIPISPSNAIIIAGVIIALAILLTNSDFKKPAGKPAEEAAAPITSLRPITGSDHIRGDVKKAEVVIVEFSDLQCPFCQRFHPTLTQIVKDYNGRVAWVYRHFPLEAIHPFAFREAEATECAAALGGQSAFWQYIDLLFASDFSRENIDASLTAAAVSAGLSKDEFSKCLASGKFKERIQADIAEAKAIGATGTPFSILLNRAGETDRVLGAEALPAVKAKIDALLK